MKLHYPFLFVATFVSQASAQVPASEKVVVEETVIESTDPETVVVEETVTDALAPESISKTITRERLDAAMARRRLGIVPKLVPAPEAPAPGSVVEKKETTTIVETPGMPPRVYNSERSVVLVEGRELPYLTIPVLFVEGSDALLDVESRIAVEDTAAAIKEVYAANPTAVFDIEGHTSTEGTDEMNLKLSADRARRIFTELTVKYGVPATALSAHGYGENFPAYPDGTEQELMLDRRVLVVRVK
ncbi:MAG: OmpA family protein [Armatimonadetes bacterium]|nr:OmpA family protein [Akkermansiaceae bacterium]